VQDTLQYKEKFILGPMRIKFLILLLLFTCFGNAYAQNDAHIPVIASIDSMINANNEGYTLVACGPLTSKRNTYKNYDSDTLISSSGFVFDSARKLQCNWSFNFHNTQLVKAVVTLNYLHQKPFYKATYYFRNNKLVYKDGEDLKYSSVANILSSAEIKHWQPISTR
jgi:hypothetical protein